MAATAERWPILRPLTHRIRADHALSYYPDLSSYDYTYNTSEIAWNVGWLSGHHPYPTGPTPAGLVKRLLKLARNPVQITRGRHVCELCSERRDTIRMQSGLRPVWLGNGEIRVTGGRRAALVTGGNVIPDVLADRIARPRSGGSRRRPKKPPRASAFASSPRP